MFGIKEENKSPDILEAPRKGIIKNKEVIAEYDEALNKENELKIKYSSKLDILKEKLGLGGASGFDSEIKTNLIDSDNVATFIDWKSGFSFFLSYFLILVILVGGLLVYLSFLENEEEKNANLLEEDILRVRENILKEEKLVEEGLWLQEKVATAEYLLENHVYWTNFFDFIEQNTFETVYFDGFNGNLKTEFSFNATADNSYFNATEQVRLFKKNEHILSVDISDFNYKDNEDSPEVTFSMGLKVDPEILYKRKKNE